MTNKTVITGASSGIGKAFVQHFANEGKNLVLIARSENSLKEMKESLTKQYNIQVDYLIFDLSKEDSSQQIYKEVRKLGGSVEMLINCAGFATTGEVNEVSYEEQHNEIMVNVVALFDLTKLFLKDMLMQNSGKIVNIASSVGYHPLPFMAVYGASKAFVVSFSEALAMETKGTNVQVFAMSPGATDTNFFSNGGGVKYGTIRTPEHVVKATLKTMEKGRVSKIDGLNNYFTSTFLPRLLTRERALKVVYNIMKKQQS